MENSKWYVEYRVFRNGHWVWEYIHNVEAKDGAEAIQYVKDHVAIGATKFHVFHEEETA